MFWGPCFFFLGFQIQIRIYREYFVLRHVLRTLSIFRNQELSRSLALKILHPTAMGLAARSEVWRNLFSECTHMLGLAHMLSDTSVSQPCHKQ